MQEIGANLNYSIIKWNMHLIAAVSLVYFKDVKQHHYRNVKRHTDKAWL